MAENCGRSCGSLRGRGFAAIGAVAIGAGLMVSAGGVAWADNELKADPSTVSAGPVAEHGIRSSATQGDVRTDGDQGQARDSAKAVPVVRATRQLDDMAATDDWNCLAAWGGKCH
ncbi:MAG: hypothetical protein ACXWZI_15290 [Mycobacterium sp.]